MSASHASAAASKYASRIIKGKKSLWEVCVGLEVHTQVLTNTKLFSGARADAGKFNNEFNNNLFLPSPPPPLPLPPPPSSSPLASVAESLFTSSVLQSNHKNTPSSISTTHFGNSSLYIDEGEGYDRPQKKSTTTSSSTSSSTTSSTFRPTHVGPNTSVAPFDAAHPGTMPSINTECITQAIRAGMSLRGDIQKQSYFERKHYSYADMPLGYQITQLAQPIVTGGQVVYAVPLRASTNGARTKATAPRIARIDRIQIEQDSGKTTHTLSHGKTLVDLNRAGVALLEVVSCPDMRSSDEAAGFLRSLLSNFVHLGITDGAFETGSLRCDVNVSLRSVDESYMKMISALEIAACMEAEAATTAAAAVVAASAINLEQSHHLSQRRPLWYTDANREGKYISDREKWNWSWTDENTYSSNINNSSNNRPILQELLEMRAENLSKFGPHVEMKNLASFRAVQRGVEHEAERQIRILEGTTTASTNNTTTNNNTSTIPPIIIERETRLFDAQAKTSIRLRSKEEANDYRFLPEPDLAPVLISSTYLTSILSTLPERLDAVATRFTLSHGLVPTDATTLVNEPGAAAFYEQAVEYALAMMMKKGKDHGNTANVEEEKKDYRSSGHLIQTSSSSVSASVSLSNKEREVAKMCANWILNEVFGALVERGTTIAQCILKKEQRSGASNITATGGIGLVDPQRIGELVYCVHAGIVSGRRAKDIMQLMLGGAHGGTFATEGSSSSSTSSFALPDHRTPLEIIAAKQWKQVNDVAIIQALAKEVVGDAESAEQVRQWREMGQQRAVGALVAKVLEKSNGLANPELSALWVKEELGPLGKRPEGKIGRKEKARLAAAAAVTTAGANVVKT